MENKDEQNDSTSTYVRSYKIYFTVFSALRFEFHKNLRFNVTRNIRQVTVLMSLWADSCPWKFYVKINYAEDLERRSQGNIWFLKLKISTENYQVIGLRQTLYCWPIAAIQREIYVL